ncbi:site-specific integrase [Planctomicrobium sp. SH664]|uniref:site-specific integrase n=1 Tax=Planctomicrobium sp. SH664 TaxID=3448125 RepID=UPI003F5CAAF8
MHPSKLNVGVLTLAFIKHADSYYRVNGEPTGEANNFREAVRQLNALFRAVPVREFGPKKLQHVRNRMIEAGKVRTSINRSIARIKHVFKWGVAQELVPSQIYTALAAVPGLRRDRSAAVEAAPVLPVPESDIEAVRPRLTAPVRAMVDLQLLTGMRPVEVRTMRCGDIDRSGTIWTYTPRSHKTQHHGRQRKIFLGPKAQMVVRPFLTDSPELFVFRPEAGRAEFVEKAYRPGASVSVRNSEGSNSPYSRLGYDASIRRACKLVVVTPWSPGRLRHNAATLIRNEFGDIDAARVVLGHSSPTITQINAEKDFEAARGIAARIG